MEWVPGYHLPWVCLPSPFLKLLTPAVTVHSTCHFLLPSAIVPPLTPLLLLPVPPAFLLFYLFYLQELPPAVLPLIFYRDYRSTADTLPPACSAWNYRYHLPALGGLFWDTIDFVRSTTDAASMPTATVPTPGVRPGAYRTVHSVLFYCLPPLLQVCRYALPTGWVWDMILPPGYLWCVDLERFTCRAGTCGMPRLRFGPV